MKISYKHILPGVAILCTGTSSLHGATIVTSGDISAAATNPDTANLGDVSITIGDFTIASTGTAGNLGWGAFGSNPEFIGTTGINLGRTVEGGEQLTLSFTSPVSLVSLSLGDHGANDNDAVISGFSSDPGASVTGLPAGWTVSYAAGAVSIDSNGNSGYLQTYTVNFASTVDVTSLEITASNVTGGAAGVGFVDVTYVPEPSSALVGGLGVLCLLRRRR
ncbi:PEP-CTERM sorting domain-containing protein [Haloferula sp. A504]|uniref:PEP-CTERM sorting domain-containing protein n=1 Tax=Haloferula sp. A504 TaxID=3373601 RepID=UPI0031C7648A|nr:PEP-CTERM sorting domain-containing protein [Verrucomicrobiaceae bacterium E54]